MNFYNLIIFNQDVWNAPTDYLGSFITPEEAINAYKQFIKKECQTKEGLIQTYELMQQEYKDEQFSETAEALHIIVSETNDFCNYNADDNYLEINVPKLFKETIDNYENI